jgi:hypothetical protein
VLAEQAGQSDRIATAAFALTTLHTIDAAQALALLDRVEQAPGLEPETRVHLVVRRASVLYPLDKEACRAAAQQAERMLPQLPQGYPEDGPVMTELRRVQEALRGG